MGKSTISMVIFNSYVKLPEGNILFKSMKIIELVCVVFLCYLVGIHMKSPRVFLASVLTTRSGKKNMGL